MAEPREVLTPVQARQGSKKRLNFRVLTTSLLLAVIAAALLYTMFYAGNTPMSTPEPVGQQTAPTTPPAPEPPAQNPAPEGTTPPETTPAP